MAQSWTPPAPLQERSPDFKHKRDKEAALWLTDKRTPAWVHEFLQHAPF
jgi:hypothetical protein